MSFILGQRIGTSNGVWFCLVCNNKLSETIYICQARNTVLSECRNVSSYVPSQMGKCFKVTVAKILFRAISINKD